MTFSSDLDRLIKLHHGDGKRLRNIRDTIRHDNFITTEDKKYVESLISTHLKFAISDELRPTPKPNMGSKQKLDSEDLVTNTSQTSSITNTKKIAIPAGIAIAIIAVIAVIGISSSSINNVEEQTTLVESVSTSALSMQIDETSYQMAEIISISGNIKNAAGGIVELKIINSNGYKIWNEFVNIKTNGEFSTLSIAGGSGWENNGDYTLKAQYGDLENEIEFIFKT